MGKHFLLDLWGVDRVLLGEMEAFIAFIAPELVDCMASVVGEASHKFPGAGGFTYLALLSTSHFSIHTWPENNSCAIDMFSCGEIMSDALISYVIRYFSPNSYNLKMINR